MSDLCECEVVEEDGRNEDEERSIEAGEVRS